MKACSQHQLKHLSQSMGGSCCCVTLTKSWCQKKETSNLNGSQHLHNDKLQQHFTRISWVTVHQLNIQVRPRVVPRAQVCQHEMEHTKQTAEDSCARASVHAAPRLNLLCSARESPTTGGATAGGGVRPKHRR